MKDKIRIANAGGFWGDDLGALKRQVEGGPVDYIVQDFLAEITMSILRKQSIKNPKLGYVTDFIGQVEENAALIKENGIKLITNAGGINPTGCAKEVIRILNDQNINLKVAVIEGDNIIDDISEFYPEKCDFKNLETGENFEKIEHILQSANVYLGFQPILKALESGADIIIAGRVTDTSISMAPMIHEFNWKLNDWDKLASGLIAGHIIECGAQSSGGNSTDWEKIKNWNNMGFPIIEAYPDSTFIVTKHEGTGGLVNSFTVKEQLVYEMGDPKNYLSPDVIVDFTTINVEDVGSDRVKVSGIKGRPATKQLKISMAYRDGFRATSSIIISGNEALKKAKLFEAILWQRLGIEFEKKNCEYVGFNSCHKNLANNIEPDEILLRFSVYDREKEKIKEFAKNIAPLILSGPQGVAVTGGRPRPQEVMTYWPSLIDKELIKSKVKIFDIDGSVKHEEELDSTTGFEEETIIEKNIKSKVKDFDQNSNKTKTVEFKEICLARSGDKGDMVNIGVVARNEEAYKYLKSILTTEYIKETFKEFCNGEVKKYELDNLHALNFLLEESLDGGGTKSLMIDAQGKTFAAALLKQKIEVPEIVLDKIK